MALEREHKFRVTGDFPDLTQLREQYAAQGVVLHSKGVREQRDVYYDTAALTLLNAGVAVRVRHLSDPYVEQTLATYKGPGRVDGSLHSREELELPYSDRWPTAILDKLEPYADASALTPLLELTTRRQRYLLIKADRAQAELTFDEVTSRRDERTASFRELELEALATITDADLKILAGPLERPGLVAHAQDKLTLVLSMLGLLEQTREQP